VGAPGLARPRASRLAPRGEERLGTRQAGHEGGGRGAESPRCGHCPRRSEVGLAGAEETSASGREDPQRGRRWRLGASRWSQGRQAPRCSAGVLPQRSFRASKSLARPERALWEGGGGASKRTCSPVSRHDVSKSPSKRTCSPVSRHDVSKSPSKPSPRFAWAVPAPAPAAKPTPLRSTGPLPLPPPPRLRCPSRRGGLRSSASRQADAPAGAPTRSRSRCHPAFTARLAEALCAPAPAADGRGPAAAGAGRRPASKVVRPAVSRGIVPLQKSHATSVTAWSEPSSPARTAC